MVVYIHERYESAMNIGVNLFRWGAYINERFEVWKILLVCKHYHGLFSQISFQWYIASPKVNFRPNSI